MAQNPKSGQAQSPSEGNFESPMTPDDLIQNTRHSFAIAESQVENIMERFQYHLTMQAVEKQILPASAKHSIKSMAKVLYQKQFIKADQKFDDVVIQEE